MTQRHYVFAGGGTGGHLYPGLAVANALRELDADAAITFCTTRRPLDHELLSRAGYAQRPQPVRPLTLRLWQLPGFWWAWQRSVRAAGTFLRENRVAAVLGLGGYAAGPPVVAAAQLGIPTAILNQDAIPGKANRFLARRVDLVVLQWEASRAHFPRDVNAQVMGCPIRPAFSNADRAAGRTHFGLDAERPVLLVTGASQGARTVNDAVMHVWPTFAADNPGWQLLHLAGSRDVERVEAAYAATCQSVAVHAFTHEMHLALAAADVVVARAGASTLAEITAVGRPGILLPYPYHRDRHQHANAQVLVDAGAAVLIEDRLDPAATGPALRTALARLADRSVRAEMEAAATRLGRPGARADVARWLHAHGKAH
jgi:UDP-N-acetylglucosamine--N-acetylmuramyl-(pentapeptide) pyrophosphoryl-undecaprenol N-acetylglucosamine transferase